ncbi:hypothetical protein KY289_022799 [Solanum tuberosum]|nr:hypothetical protein KY289_022799 [Solanum tuberosum]
MLKYLLVGSNLLNGVLPNSIGNLSSTSQNFYIGDAHINGLIPTGISNMSGLMTLDFQGNNLAGSIPPEIEGEVPSDIGELKAIVGLYLCCNHFSSVIPTRFGELQNLQYLDLSNNSFFGQIPLSFANLISLEILNLSLNSLSGLCGMHILEIPACAINNPGKQSKLKEVVLKIVTPVISASFLIFLLVSIWIMKRQKKGKSKDVEKVPEIRTHQLVSYHEIQLATNNFDESNLIAISKSMAHTETLGTLGYIAPETRSNQSLINQ